MFSDSRPFPNGGKLWLNCFLESSPKAWEHPGFLMTHPALTDWSVLENITHQLMIERVYEPHVSQEAFTVLILKLPWLRAEASPPSMFLWTVPEASEPGWSAQSAEGHDPAGFSFLPHGQRLWPSQDGEAVFPVGQKTWLDQGPGRTGLTTPGLNNISNNNNNNKPPEWNVLLGLDFLVVWDVYNSEWKILISLVWNHIPHEIWSIN